MNLKFLHRLNYSYIGQTNTYPLPTSLENSLKLISSFLRNNTSNKLCLVFPSKEFVAQWLSIPLSFSRLVDDFDLFKGEIFESYKQYKPGERLILNDSSIVEWVKGTKDTITIKTTDKSGCDTLFNLKHADIIKLQPAPSSRNSMSSLERIKKDLPKKNKSALDLILDLDTYGNNLFQKNSVCLVSKYVSYDDSIYNLCLNNFNIENYSKSEKIRENGTIESKSPLLLTNNLSNLSLYLTQSTSISEIIIDGYSLITERLTDFSDIDSFKIPTILVTDLSEIDTFEYIRNNGFEFFNFTSDIIIPSPVSFDSPFYNYSKKLQKYVEFKFHKEICNYPELESIVKLVHSFEQDDSNNDFNILNISLIHLLNRVSGLAHPTSEIEMFEMNQKLDDIVTIFTKNRIWLGEQVSSIEGVISDLKQLLERLTLNPPDKYTKLAQLLDINRYDYIICPTATETLLLSNYLKENIQVTTPKVISVSNVNDSLLSDKSIKVILTSWPKSGNLNKILSSFLFSEITALYYPFENRYHNSLQRRNIKFTENVNSTVDIDGIHFNETQKKLKGFRDLFETDVIIEEINEDTLDIVDFEMRVESVQYSRYEGQNNSDESVRAKRIDFEQDVFVFATETHKFLIINNLLDLDKQEKKISKRRVESLKTGDIIAFINTERDILVELVEKNTNSEELALIKYWTELWKKVLRDYYVSIGNDFMKLVEDLRMNECKKHEVTIRTWLQDVNRIGPDDDSDLLSIAMLTESKELFENIEKVRSAIRAMIGLRMKASDYITNQIKSRLPKLMNTSIINSEVHIEGLGNLIVLKVKGLSNKWMEIDIRYINKLLYKEVG